MKVIDFEKYKSAIRNIPLIRKNGQVKRVIGLIIESLGPEASIGEICLVYPSNHSTPVHAEVVGFRENIVLLMPLGEMYGIKPGSEVVATGKTFTIPVGDFLLGRVLDGLGNFIDELPKPRTREYKSIHGKPPNPLHRKRIKDPFITGIRAIDGVITCGRGQRVGIFAGSGVGKSVLLGMIARESEADVNVIALIGERGREVKEFIERDLGEEGLKRSVVVVCTSDQPALSRLNGAYIATSIAEFFREEGKNVLLMMDSVTRFAMAQREIGLAVGEPPTTKGYTPSVFCDFTKTS